MVRQQKLYLEPGLSIDDDDDNDNDDDDIATCRVPGVDSLSPLSSPSRIISPRLQPTFNSSGGT